MKTIEQIRQFRQFSGRIGSSNFPALLRKIFFYPVRDAMASKTDTNHDQLMKKVKVLQAEITELEWQLKHEVLSIAERVHKRQQIIQLKRAIEVHCNALGIK